MAKQTLTRKIQEVAAGQRFGRLVAVSFHSRNRHSQQLWRFRCDCGNELVARVGNVNRGATRSCGCLNAETPRTGARTHGKTLSPEYNSWKSMIARCTNPKATGFSRYGGRGIKVCEQWLTFERFYVDMGDRPEGTTLDRERVDGDYEPGNCRWATKPQQARTRSDNAVVDYNGEKLILKDYAKRIGLDYWCLHNRMRRAKETPEQAAAHLLARKTKAA